MSKLYVLELSEGVAEKIAASKRHPAARRGAAFKEGWAMGKEVAGYNETSPIWGKTRYEVFDEIETLYIEALEALKVVNTGKFQECSDRISMLHAELQKRSAANELAKATRKA